MAAGDEMAAGIDIDGHRENDDERADPLWDDDDDDPDPAGDVSVRATSNVVAVPDKSKDKWIIRGQQGMKANEYDDYYEANVHKRHNDGRAKSYVDGRRSRNGKEMHQDDRNADDGEYDRERRRAAVDDEGHGGKAADRYKQNGFGEGDENDRHTDDGNEGEHDGIDGDGEPGYNGAKDAGKDADAGEVIGDEDDVNGNANAVNEDVNEGGNAVEGDSGKSYDTCDAECKKFRGQLDSWPSDKPKAFIYYLIHRRSMPSLQMSIRALHRNFNRRFRYPIVVFVEPELDNPADRRRIADIVPADSESPPPSIYVQVVRFQIPDYVNASLVPRMAGFGSRKRTIGYRHMCRFHAGGVYDQPIVRSPGLQYGWRLDDDSLIRRPINYDLFQVMRDGGYQYGYRRINSGWSPVDYALWDAVDRYLNATPSLTPTFYRQWPKNAARYFNNFEVSDLRVWMSPQYRDYFNFVDRLGGIYYHKWGDAAIKTIAVTLFIPRDRTHLFKGIAYFHT